MKKFFIAMVLACLFVSCGETSNKCQTCQLSDGESCGNEESCQPCELDGYVVSKDEVVTALEVIEPQEIEPQEEATAEIVAEIAEPEVLATTGLITRCEFAELVYQYIYNNEEEQPIIDQNIPDLYPAKFCSMSANTLVGKGLMTLFPDGTFRPDDYINRAEAIKVIMDTMEIPVFKCPEGKSAYMDVGMTDSYVRYAEGAACYEIMCSIDFFTDEITDDRGGCGMVDHFHGDEFVDHEWIFRIARNIHTALINGLYLEESRCMDYSAQE
jgi:hypothetical protein